MALTAGPEENKATRFELKFKQSYRHETVKKPILTRLVIINLM
jgi:hypothetical protein